MDKEFFIGNRATLFAAVRKDVIVVASNHSMQRSNDASYIFEQEANFWYLTGIAAADWWLVIEKKRSILVAPDVDEIHRIFDGSLSNSEALEQSGVDQVLSHLEGERLLIELKDKNATISTIGEDPHKKHYDFGLNSGPVDMLAKLQQLFGTVDDCRKLLSKLRAVKQPQEITLIRNAIALTIDAFKQVKNNFRQYAFEYEIEADFTHYFRSHGATGHAYDPIVATGKNACTLHYIKNQTALADGEVVLLDVGVRLSGYAADITRTYAYGYVSERYKSVHLAVENAHKEIIALLKPGLSVKEYFDKVDVIMVTAIGNLGLLKEKSDYRRYFPHSISHGLGIDVHDSLGGPEVFLPGMVLTVEPGIYIPEEGVGVRIEDDILITEDGHENLSSDLPTSL
jgi:Xaa-Pro aminopeptidase